MTNANHAVVMAVDVGGTSFKGALVDETGRIRFEEAVRLSGQNGEAAFADLQGLCDGLKARASADGLDLLTTAVIAPGMDDATGRVLFASNLGWRDLPVRDRLEHHLQMPVATGHDVRSAGLAEALLGAGHAVRDMAFVMIGTGIAAALLCNGQFVSGARNTGGELGHAPVIANGERCACGQLGCLEAYASAASIARRYRMLGGSKPLSAAEIGLAQPHDALARQVWTEAVEALSLGLTTLTMLLDPQMFVLGGGLVEAGPLLFEPLTEALRRRLTWRPAPPIRRSVLGLSAGRMGAAILAYRLAGRGDLMDRWAADAERPA